MKDKDNVDFDKVISDISILYELSLAGGQSLDLKTNCDRFLKTLMARKNLAYASVWIKREYLIDPREWELLEEGDENAAFLIYAYPQSRMNKKSLPSHHPIFSLLKCKEAFSISSSENRFSEIITEKGINKGTFAIFALGQLGFLKLFSMTGETPFREEELNQLKNVISKFTFSIEGCIDHQKAIREITERKRAEEALRQSEERYRTLVEESFDGIFIQKGPKVIFSNRPLYEMLGYEKGELEGHDHWLVYHPDYWELTRERAQARMRGESVPSQYEVKLQRKDGSSFDGEINARRIMFGNEPGIQVWARDITERKRAERALRESEEKYRTIIENIEEGYYEVDLAGNFTFFNDSLCWILGYSREEMLGMNNRQYTDQENAKKLYQAFNKVYRTGQPSKEFNWEIIRKDGTRRYIEASVSLIKNPSGQPIGFRGIVRDITERKRAEEALQRSEETATRLAQENAIMAEIGRIISSTLKIEEVYEHFTEEVRKLIPFDRIAIRAINPKDNTTTTAYISGVDVPGRRLGSTVPLFGTVIEECIRTQSSLLFQPESMDEVVNRFPHLLPTFKAGLRSMIFVPLISKDQVIGVLSLQATEPKAHTEGDLRLAERVGNQIAGAIANAQLFAEHKRAEEALVESEEKFRDLYDNAPLGYHEYNLEGRITNVNCTDLEMLGYTAEEMIGQPMWKFNVGEETVREQILAKLDGTLPPGRNLERTYRRKDGTTFPVLIEDRLILDEKGCIKGIRCTIQDITGIKQAEEALQRSEEGAKRIAHENAIVAEIGRIVSSTLNIEEVYERFAEEVCKLITFDRIIINIVNPEADTQTIAYISGVDVENRRFGDIIPLSGTATGECIRTRSSFLFQTESIDEVTNRFPGLLPTFKAGLRSMIFVPVSGIAKGTKSGIGGSFVNRGRT